MGTDSRQFEISGVNHVGLAAKDPAQAKWFFHSLLGLASFGDELVKEQETNTQMYASHTASSLSGAGPRLEVLVPTSETSPIAKFLAKKGSGIHHIALTVTNVTSAIAYLRANGVRMIDEQPRGGAHHTSIAFVHPESTGGLLVELVQEQNHV
jgi:methylmalonyl-CoA/ethylmalonyl-CoA epimerase